MQGSLTLIPAEKGKPRRLIYLKTPPTLNQIRTLMGGTYELVPEFETIEHNQGIRECTAFCRDALEAHLEEETPNHWGNLLWGMSLARKYEYRGVPTEPGATLKGPVLIITGDDEFLAAVR